MKTCTLCDKPSRALGLCMTHYNDAKRRDRGARIIARRGMTTLQKLQLYVVPGTGDECFKWIGSVNTSGYGRIQIDGQRVLAHRAAYIVFKGEIPEGMKVLHRCDNPRCTNPEHLFLGTQLENIADMMQKNRQYDRTGSKHGKAKLTESDVLAIRADTRSHKEIANDYGIVVGYVGNIKRRLTWKHI